MSFKIYWSIFLLLISFQLHSQSTLTTNNWSVQAQFQYQDITGGDDAISIGQLGVLDEVKFRPRVGLGLVYWRKTTTKKRKYLLGELSYYNNTYQADWVTLSLGTGTERIFWNKLILNYGFNTGIAHIKNADVQYIYESDKWVATNNRDVPVYNLVLGPQLAIGYRFGHTEHPIDLLITSDFRLHLNIQLGGILPYNALGLNVRYGF